MIAQACGGRGFRVTQPQALRETVALALSTPGPVIVDVIVDPGEIPSMPHIDVGKAWRFGIGKIASWPAEQEPARSCATSGWDSVILDS